MSRGIRATRFLITVKWIYSKRIKHRKQHLSSRPLAVTLTRLSKTWWPTIGNKIPKLHDWQSCTQELLFTSSVWSMSKLKKNSVTMQSLTSCIHLRFGVMPTKASKDGFKKSLLILIHSLSCARITWVAWQNWYHIAIERVRLTWVKLMSLCDHR